MTWPIRVRLTVTYVLTALVLTAVGGVLFWASVHSGLENNRDGHLRSRTVRLISVVERNGVNAIHTNTPSNSDTLLQLVTPSGAVNQSSPDLNGTTLLDQTQLAAVRRNAGFYTVGPGPDFRLYAAPVTTSNGTWVVIAATPLRAQNELSDTVTRTLAIAAAGVVVLGGLGAWFLARASLRPVERLRREVATISETDPSVSVHVPQTGDELAALAETMNALLARISAGLARQRQFVADASHEVRTPLANLRTTLELAGSRARTPEELADAVRYCEQEVIRLGHLVDDLLVLAAADDQVPLDKLPSSPVRPLLEAAVVAAGSTAETKAVRFRVVAETDLAAAFHPGRLRQVLDNLVSNALRHAKSEVSLTAIADGDSLLIEVADDGPGFPDGFAEHAFERFRRADTSRSRNDGGSGLGLAVVRAIAEAHGGGVEAGNKASGGGIVRVRLPLSC